MKTWLTYLAAVAMGLAFELTFRDSTVFVSTMAFLSNVVIKLGIFMVFPLAFFTMSSGTASLSRRRGRTSFVWLSTIFWAIFTSLVLSIIAALIFRLFPAAFPVTSTTPQSAEESAAIYQSLTGSTLSKLVTANPLSINSFLNFIKSSDCLLPIIFIALAYITLNSISETMFRLARQISSFLWIAIFFIAGAWFNDMWLDGTIFYSWRFTSLLAITVLLILLVAIPLVYAIVTGFRRNPYRQLSRLISAGVASFFSVNYLFSQCTLYTDCRINLGIQKSVVSTALPLHSILTKGGSALISTMCTCSLYCTVNGGIPSLVQTVTIAFACTLVSFISCLHAGYEVIFTASFALGLLNVSIAGAEFSILGLIPILNGAAIMLDVVLAGLGTSFTACHLKADCNVAERDNV